MEKRIPAIGTLLLFLLACSSESEHRSSHVSAIKSPLELVLENGNSNLSLGDTLYISADQQSGSATLSNIELYLNDSIQVQSETLPLKWKVSTNDLKLGKNRVRLSAQSAEKIENKVLSFTLMSDREPAQYSYKVVRSYPHDKLAYTQGLIFHDGFLYEGTGQKGRSSLRKVELETGKVIQKHDLDDNLFGEGIALLGNKLYQLSWVSQVGFIYDINTFKELNRFYYQGEGWGITTDGINLFRSDGSNKIYVHDPNDFQVISTIEVYTDKASLNRLNELEFIDGKIYANIWQSDDIAIIDPANGLCEAIISLKGLLSKNERDENTDVLNGIAYDMAGGRLFVTGKNWSKIFEIKLYPKTAG